MSLTLKNIIFLVLCLLVISCKAQEFNIDNESIKVINHTLNNYRSICMVKETYYGHSYINPEYIINNYLRVYNNTVNKKSPTYEFFYKELNGIISREELIEMKEKKRNWSIKEWSKSSIIKKEIEFLSIREKISLECSTKEVLRISEPLFSSDMRKAIIMISSSKDKIGGFGIQVLEKKNKKWVVKGGIPIGTSG